MLLPAAQPSSTHIARAPSAAWRRATAHRPPRASSARSVGWVGRGRPLGTVGGGGGQLDPRGIRMYDLALTIQAPLLSKVRAQLRKHHGFPRGPKAKFKVSGVYSDEPLIYPEAAVC